MATKQPMRILCFGDSLTAGYNMYGMRLDPYSEEMEAVLKRVVGKEFEIEVKTDGVSGQQVVSGFRARMEEKYSSARSQECPYDWVIFLGGTNDMAWGVQSEDIYQATQEITAIPLGCGAHVLLMTVPECGVKSASVDAKRDRLNNLIKNDGREGVFTFDLHAKIPYHALPEAERNQIWDDGLHFTPMGYERVGTLVAERLVEILSGKPA